MDSPESGFELARLIARLFRNSKRVSGFSENSDKPPKVVLIAPIPSPKGHGSKGYQVGKQFVIKVAAKFEIPKASKILKNLRPKHLAALGLVNAGAVYFGNKIYDSKVRRAEDDVLTKIYRISKTV